MSEWPKIYKVRDVGVLVKLEDFERLLEFAISAIQAAGQTDRDREAIKHDIIETIQDRIWRDKNGNVAD
jgi:hypothetical protein